MEDKMIRTVFNNGKYIKYEHHGVEVIARKDLKGKHRESCLCYECSFLMSPCPIAKDLFALDKKYHIVTPVFECPDFKEEKEV